MKKNTIKAFTLVEMLIVIVIIGILIAALMPRMQSAQGRARDVSRKNALSQIQTAIVTHQQDKWEWPDLAEAKAQGISIRTIEDDLITAWMSSVPWDPLASNEVSWLGNGSATWEYLYMVTMRNWTANWWFVLMAKTEVEWWSNWAVCWNDLSWWKITAGTDLKYVTPCTKLTKGSSCSIVGGSSWCTYQNDWDLRYILTY